MNVISSTFWGEGPSDERFLPKIIQRTLEAVLMECARGEWEVLEPCILKSRETDFPQQVVDIAKQSQGFTLVFVHTDADAPNETQRANSKELLSNAMKAATDQRGKRRNQFNLEDIDDALSKRISLQKIARFDSFQHFFERLKENLIHQNIIREDCEVVFV